AGEDVGQQEQARHRGGECQPEQLFRHGPLPSTTCLAWQRQGRPATRRATNTFVWSAAAGPSPALSSSTARLLELPHLGDRVLEEAGVFVDGLVVLVPADILAAILGTGLIDGAFAVAVEKLAGFEVLLDQLLALAGDLDEVALLELAHGEAEKLGEPTYVLPADLDIPCDTATEARTFTAVERRVLTVLSHHQPRADSRGHSASNISKGPAAKYRPVIAAR